MNISIRPHRFSMVLCLLLFPLTSLSAVAESQWEEEGGILVGRISHVEGEVFQYAPDEEEWVPTVKDAPFGMNDALSTERHGRAEIIMPNNTWVRMDGRTQVQLLALENNLTEMDIPYGLVRVHNKGTQTEIKVTTPFGDVRAPAESSFDLQVDDDSAKVIAQEGAVYFTHGIAGPTVEVISGSSSVIADSRGVTAGVADGFPGWDEWNRDRDVLWAKRLSHKDKSALYLPPALHDHAYVLDDYGRWERVYYEGAYSYLWRPLHVGVGWAPFTAGRWTVWYGENTWIPYEPFGYVTHHYGSWVFVRGSWYWGPPVARARLHLYRPAFYTPFAWYPGRVGWIHFGVNVGWFPLAPNETYYSHRQWGPRTVAIRDIYAGGTELHIQKYRHYKHATIINRNTLYRVDNYRTHGIRNIKSVSAINSYRVVPIINERVIRDYRNIRERGYFTRVGLDKRARGKPEGYLPPSRSIPKARLKDRPGGDRRGLQENRAASVPESPSKPGYREGREGKGGKNEMTLKGKEIQGRDVEKRSFQGPPGRWTSETIQSKTGGMPRSQALRREPGIQNQRANERDPRKEGSLGRGQIRVKGDQASSRAEPERALRPQSRIEPRSEPKTLFRKTVPPSLSRRNETIEQDLPEKEPGDRKFDRSSRPLTRGSMREDARAPRSGELQNRWRNSQDKSFKMQVERPENRTLTERPLEKRRLQTPPQTQQRAFSRQGERAGKTVQEPRQWNPGQRLGGTQRDGRFFRNDSLPRLR